LTRRGGGCTVKLVPAAVTLMKYAPCNLALVKLAFLRLALVKLDRRRSRLEKSSLLRRTPQVVLRRTLRRARQMGLPGPSPERRWIPWGGSGGLLGRVLGVGAAVLQRRTHVELARLARLVLVELSQRRLAGAQESGQSRHGTPHPALDVCRPCVRHYPHLLPASAPPTIHYPSSRRGLATASIGVLQHPELMIVGVSVHGPSHQIGRDHVYINSGSVL
jgi:hypothetical protein